MVRAATRAARGTVPETSVVSLLERRLIVERKPGR